jgi:hypothetical protein
MAFIRQFSDVEKLKEELLFQNCLLPDIVQTFLERKDKGRDVFPAVRNERVDFYHKGGKLFSYNVRNGFTTHHKYASVIKSEGPNQYVTDANLKAIGSFIEGYERIKENCSLYSGIEAQGVSQVYGPYSCAKRQRSHSVVVLDIEVSLRRGDKDVDLEPGKTVRASTDQIDLLLFDTESSTLRFFEAKDFSNGEIRAAPGYEPKIVSQMERYGKQLRASGVREELLSAYKTHVDVINRLFNPEVPLPVPEYVDPKARLLLFGFDMPQLTGKLKREAKRLENEYGICVYPIGEIKKVNPGTLFSGGRKRW